MERLEANRDNSFKRRGIVAGLTAAVVAALSRVSERTAFAQTGLPILGGVVNAETNPTGIQTTNVTALLVQSGSSIAVQSSSIDSIGVYSTSVNHVGVFGGSTHNTGFAGSSQAGQGVYGQSTSAAGIQGQSTSGGGLVGGSSSGPGVQGTSSTYFSGIFNGGLGVYINGDFTVTGTKSAAVPFPDGSLRRVYCLESPESFFEDFGDAVLDQGSAQVALNADFAAVVRTANYRVFLTPLGDCNGLYVSVRDQNGFSVRELRGGAASVGFSYRVVAYRKDIAGPRLEPVKREHGVPVQPGPKLPPPVLRQLH